MAFNHYLEDENDKDYYNKNSLAYYYDKMEGFAKAVEGSAKALNLTKEEIEQRIALRLAEWDKNLESFDGSVEKLLTEWVDDGTLTPLIDSTLIDQKIAPVTAQLAEKVGGGVKLEPEEFGDRALALVTGEGNINVLSIPQDNSVTPEKTTFLKTGDNLFNINESKSGKFSSSGAETVDSLSIITNYVPVSPGDSIFLYINNGQTVFDNRIVIYDIEKNILETLSTYKSGDVLTNPNVKFMRTSVAISSVESGFGINKNSLKPHQPYHVTFENIKISKDDVVGLEVLPNDSVDRTKLSPEVEKVVALPQDTFENITLNGDFSEGLTNWTANRDGAIVSVTNKVLTAEMVSTSLKANWQPLQTNEKLVTGSKYFFSVEIQPDKTDTVVLSLKTKGTTYFTINAGVWNYVSAIIDVDVAPDALNRIAMIFNTLKYATGNKISWTNVNVINLTQKYGAGNEPTKEFMDNTIKPKAYVKGSELVNVIPSVPQIAGFNGTEMKLHDHTEFTSHLYGDEMVCFGDSITGNEFIDDYPSIIAKRTGMKVHNVGFGGTRIGYHEQADYDKFSFYRLVDAVISGDYSTLKQPFANGRPTPYNPRVAILEKINWNNVKYISVAYMANDWGANSPNEGATNEDSKSVRGAGRLALRKLLTKYPHLKVLIISPFYRYFTDTVPVTDSDDTPRGLANWYMREYVEASRELAKEFHFPFVDVYNGLGINKYTRGQYFDGVDGTHHDARGRIHIGNKIASAILSEY